MIKVREINIEAAQDVDRATQALVPNLANGTLPTDPEHLGAMFMFCTNNWRTYPGKKPQGDNLARINAVYKQATLGDCTNTTWETAFEKKVVNMWRGYKGTPPLTAKRRFLTLLRDVDPCLLQIKAYHLVPWGFPTSAKGERICPYSNAKKGCPRPLVDKYGNHLEHELESNECLSDFARLRDWLDEAAAQQRCSLGLHVPISKDMGRRFSTFFRRSECGGFQPYTSKGFHEMVKKGLTKQMLAVDTPQCNDSRKFCRIAQTSRQDRFLVLQQFYKSFTGQEFSIEMLCSRDSHHCNTRRLVEGSNHTHPVVSRILPTDLSLYDELIQVRRECERLGVTPVTGPVHNIDHRHRLLQMKVVDFHLKKMLVYESQRRQQWRSDIAPLNAELLKAFSREHLSQCLRDALAANDMDRIVLAVESGADPCIELRGGLFPLMAVVLTRSTSHIQRLLALGVNVDTANSKGMTALMWAVKRDDYAMVDVLLEEGADIGLEGCTGWTAMSIAARHGRVDITQLLVDYALRRDKSVGGMVAANRVLNHWSSIKAGLTPVAIAAIHRNELIVRFLMRLGAKRDVKCYQGYTAAEHATKAGWTALGNWLRETRAFGSKGVYTFADMSTESALRVGRIRMLDAIVSGATEEDNTEGIRNKGASYILFPGPSESLQSPSVEHRYGVIDIYDQMLDNVPSNTLLTVKVLKEGHAAPDTETDRGHTALISAAYRGLEKCVRELIQEGADPNYTNRNDRTALMAAATAGHYNAVVVLLAHGANASCIDIDGKVAGGYAFERGFRELAELLAVAASRGNEKALDWEVKRRKRAEEDEKCTLGNNDLGRTGIQRGTHEADLHQSTIRARKPRESARVTEMRQTSSQLGLATTSRNPGRCAAEQDNSDGGAPHSPQAQRPRREARCPKCTLFVRCRHYASLEAMMAQFPDGVPEWRWNKRGVEYKVKLRKCSKKSLMNPSCNGKEDLLWGDNNVAWWRTLYKVHRDRELPSRGCPGTGSARNRYKADKMA